MINRKLWLWHEIRQFLPSIKTSHMYALEREYGNTGKLVSGKCSCGAIASEKDIEDCNIADKWKGYEHKG